MSLRFGHSSMPNITSRLLSRKIDTWLVQPLAKGTHWLLSGTFRFLPASPLVNSSTHGYVCKRETNRQGSHAWRYRTSSPHDIGSMLYGRGSSLRGDGEDAESWIAVCLGSCQAGCGPGVEPRSVPTDNVGTARGVMLI